MKKNISYIFAIILAAVLAVQLNDPWRHVDPAKLYTAIISTDGAIVPGTRQDFLVNLFKETDTERTFESKPNLNLRLLFPLVNGKKEETTVHLTTAFPGKYTGSCQIPENTDYSEVVATLYPDSRIDKPVMTCKIPVKQERAIIVRPPQQQIFTGDKITFEFVSVEKKSSLPLMKIPVRVKMISPSGITTLNRLVSTDTEGFGVFKTQIHKSSPEGYYTFVFQSSTFEQKFTIYIKQQSSDEPISLATIPTYLPDQETNENSGFIYNLNCQNQDALLAYGCPDSDHRQIEIWQNGKIHYFANLNLEGGTISLMLQKPLLAGCPALFKIWQIFGNEVVAHEKIRYIEPKFKNKVNQFLVDLNSEFQNTEKDKLALALARKGFIGLSPKLTYTNITLIQNQNLKSVNPSSKNEKPIDYYQNLLKEITDSPSFEIVESFKNLQDCNNSTIYLDSKTFLENYITYLNSKENNLNRLLQEGICLVDLFNLQDLPEKAETVEKVESLLIPLSELYAYLEHFPKQKNHYAPAILSVITKIKDIAFVPADFLFDCSIVDYELDEVPMLNFSPNNRSFQSIQGLLKESGTIQISNGISTQTIKLEQPQIHLPYGYSHLTINRNLPVVLSHK